MRKLRAGKDDNVTLPSKRGRVGGGEDGGGELGACYLILAKQGELRPPVLEVRGDWVS